MTPLPKLTALEAGKTAGALLAIALAATAAPPQVSAGFVNATTELGLWGSQPTWGAQALDFDGDGDIDYFNAHHFYSGYLFANDGNDHFDVWGLPQPISSAGDRHGYLWIDLDNDGDLDGVCSHGGDGGSGTADDPNELWEGLGAGLFQLVPGAGGMADTVGRGRAFSAADVDGDGDLDLWHGKAVLSGHPNSLYRNDGNLTFVEVAPAWGLDESLGTVGGRFVDYDDDGDPDLLVGGEEFGRPTLLLRNDGGAFVDVTTAAFGGALPIVSGVDWADYDADGDVDLAAVTGKEGIYDAWGIDGIQYWWFANHRHSDDGVDYFQVDTPGEDPIAAFRFSGVVWEESIFLGPSAVNPTQATVTLTDDYVGMPTFTPGVDHGVYVWRESVGGTWHFAVVAPPGIWGNFTLKLTTVGAPVNPGASNLEPQPVTPSSVRVWRNDGGTFTETGGSLGFTPSANPRDVIWVDFDNDGDIDLHQMNKGTVEIGNEADILWRNDGGTFVALTDSSGVPGLEDHFTDGGVWADFDRDGDLDLFLQEGTGAVFFSGGTPALAYRNKSATGHWLVMKPGLTLAGGTPVGVRVTCHAGSLVVHQRLDADAWRGFHGPGELHFGLGSHVLVDSLVVDWPGGGRQVTGPIPADNIVEFAEGEPPTAAPTSDPISPVEFAGPVYPQPSAGRQRIVLTPPRPGVVGVRIVDVRGRLVRLLRPRSRIEAPTVLRWDGRDEAGRRVAAGVYFVRGEGDFPFERKAVRIR